MNRHFILKAVFSSWTKIKKHKKSPAASICDKASWENDLGEMNYSTIRVDFIVAWPAPHMTEHWMV
jgi:hypothetical protein